MINLEGKVAVVFGVANKRSIAYSICEKLATAGATLVISYQSERLRKDSEELLASLGQAEKGLLVQCDVADDAQIDAAFEQIAARFPVVHTLVHSIGFAPADAIKNDFLLTKREDFKIAHDISVYSFIALARAVAPLMTEGGSLLTLTYYGADKVFPNYNVMGVAKAGLEASVRYLAASLGTKNIRVNGISAGPIKTLAARGIGDFTTILDEVTKRAPLHRNVEQAEVANTALFLSSDLASGITGEITFVDCGFNVTGI
ncbi:enoyl-ACP reductase [Granulicella cerasi]|uniref:Enoyl-[acyl-carrier-protein] reductase [NADH] n=1 Tax=Granulicella cerasi TaxID=741063 RepID=A0ABW1ZE78_9BACT|nr:enoyl-ACP reductase [Granulicella cerasi]